MTFGLCHTFITDPTTNGFYYGEHVNECYPYFAWIFDRDFVPSRSWPLEKPFYQRINSVPLSQLTHLPLVPHICVSESGRIGSPIWRQAIIQTNAKSPIWRQAIIQTNANLLTIGPLGTIFSEILVKIQKIFIHENAFENIVCEMVAILSRRRWVNGW